MSKREEERGDEQESSIFGGGGGGGGARLGGAAVDNQWISGGSAAASMAHMCAPSLTLALGHGAFLFIITTLLTIIAQNPDFRIQNRHSPDSRPLAYDLLRLAYCSVAAGIALVTRYN
ncbi:hypothetical protein EJ05DRAFT_500633 [Pseudovirgaria hyperparasitica]|uniref:Uncharacterized protein n=1 Tax=Pseudovirgaria hyperparasitica TaxID=470096 RepID=A0A6A6W6E6_9PEZI|nr:uncharacterized protein EJ05DRAFT_500633 [Pseudovirgaria hyperparasitica]KAF2758115.1 hypothetical protein EJ05DRAFT_500633 [Pseudovirgaria hyperparasitica]